MLDQIRAALEAITRDPALDTVTSYAARAAALDTLEVDVLDRLDSLEYAAGQPDDIDALRRSAEALRRRLEAADTRLFRDLRAQIRAGACDGPALREAISACAGYDPSDQEGPGGYDSLDTFLNGLLGVTAVPAETAPREPEMVAYQKTPARVVLRLLEFAVLAEHDVFYDIGAGLGHVPILVHLLSGARAVGVELEPAYCAAARACAAGLGLARVTFVQADARAADYAAGTVFFLYTPFVGRMLEDVLGRLRDEARRRAIRLAAFGPCVPAVTRQPWLARDYTCADRAGELALFRSR